MLSSSSFSVPQKAVTARYAICLLAYLAMTAFCGTENEEEESIL